MLNLRSNFGLSRRHPSIVERLGQYVAQSMKLPCSKWKKDESSFSVTATLTP
jgi:hypothetical protein